MAVAPGEDGGRAREAPAVAALVLGVRRRSGFCFGVHRVGFASDSPSGSCYHRAGPRQRAFSSNGEHQAAEEARPDPGAAERLENLRYRSTIKTLTKRLEGAAADGDAERIATEHRELVRTIDRATTRGALHGNTAARKKSQCGEPRLAGGAA